MPQRGQRAIIKLVTPTGVYEGGMRNLQAKGWPYICPDLKGTDGIKISLAEILEANDIPLRNNQSLRFDITFIDATSPVVWTLI